LRILFARDKSSLVLSLNTILKFRTVFLGMFYTNRKFFRESKFRDNLNQGYFDLKFMFVRDEII
jgi:hypothetical protein